MSYHEWLRIVVLICTAAFAVLAAMLVWKWHKEPDGFDLRDLLMSIGKDGKPHLSRAAVGEIIALFATTSGYLGALAAKPDSFETATAVYGSLWVIRGAYASSLKNQQPSQPTA